MKKNKDIELIIFFSLSFSFFYIVLNTIISSEIAENIKTILYIALKVFLFSVILLLYYKVLRCSVVWSRSLRYIFENLLVIILLFSVLIIDQRISISSLYKQGAFSLSLIVLNISTGMIEEVLFRGVLFDYFYKSKKIILAFVLSSFIFGFVHLLDILIGAPFNPILIINLCILGFLLSIIYYSYGLISAIIFHAIWNIAFNFTRVEEEPITGIIVLLFSIILLWRNMKFLTNQVSTKTEHI
jgi:membrane protease YdiL (CAAX protease family)